MAAHGKRTIDTLAPRRAELPAAGRMIRPPAHPANDNPIPRAVLVRRLGAALISCAIIAALITGILFLA